MALGCLAAVYYRSLTALSGEPGSESFGWGARTEARSQVHVQFLERRLAELSKELAQVRAAHVGDHVRNADADVDHAEGRGALSLQSKERADTSEGRSAGAALRDLGDERDSDSGGAEHDERDSDSGPRTTELSVLQTELSRAQDRAASLEEQLDTARGTIEQLQAALNESVTLAALASAGDADQEDGVAAAAGRDADVQAALDHSEEGAHSSSRNRGRGRSAGARVVAEDAGARVVAEDDAINAAQQQQQQQQRRRRATRGVVPRTLPPSAEAVVSSLAKRLLFPSPAWANPVRRAWVRSGLDWHNLVKPAPSLPEVLRSLGLRHGTGAEAALARFHREASKAGLLHLLQGYAGVRGDVRGGEEEVDALGAHQEGARPRTFHDVDTDLLTPLRSPTSNHGPLSKFAACAVVRDRCVVHASVRACVGDQLCGWCDALELCMDRFHGTFPGGAFWPEKEAGARVRACPGHLYVERSSIPSVFWAERLNSAGAGAAATGAAAAAGAGAAKRGTAGASASTAYASQPHPVALPFVWQMRHDEGEAPEVRRVAPKWVVAPAAGGATDASASMAAPEAPSHALSEGVVSLPNCSVVVTRARPLFLSILGDAKMAYHFWTQSAAGWHADASAGGGLEHLAQHVWVDPRSDPSHLHLAHTLSDSCWRYPGDMPPGVTVCYAHGPRSRAPRVAADDPMAVAVDHVTGEPIAAAASDAAASDAAASDAAAASDDAAAADALFAEDDGGSDTPVQSTGGASGARSTLRYQEPLVLVLPLEPLAVAVARGMRLGTKGMAALLRSLLPQQPNANSGGGLSSSSDGDDAASEAASAGSPSSTARTRGASGHDAAPSLLQSVDPELRSSSSFRSAVASLGAAFEHQGGSSLPGWIVYSLGLWDALPRHAVQSPASSPSPSSSSRCLGPPAESTGGVPASMLPECPSPATQKPLVVLISRKNKRFLQNEPQLVSALLSGITAADLFPPSTPNGGSGSAPDGEETPRRRSALVPIGGGINAVPPWGVVPLAPVPPCVPRGSAGASAAAPAPVIDVEVATLEDMPLWEQMALFRRASVLVGVHGSGLVNALFMHPGTALVQLVPRGITTAASFFGGPAASAGVAYHEYVHRVGDPAPDAHTRHVRTRHHGVGSSSAAGGGHAGAGQGGAANAATGAGGNTSAPGPTDDPTDPAGVGSVDGAEGRDVNHWHFLDGTFRARREELLQAGAECCGQATFFTFFINRDMVVPPDDFVRVVGRALQGVMATAAAAAAASDGASGGIRTKGSGGVAPGEVVHDDPAPKTAAVRDGPARIAGDDESRHSAADDAHSEQRQPLEGESLRAEAADAVEGGVEGGADAVEGEAADSALMPVPAGDTADIPLAPPNGEVADDAAQGPDSDVAVEDAALADDAEGGTQAGASDAEEDGGESEFAM